jgi:folate-binding protein YgfZ
MATGREALADELAAARAGLVFRVQLTGELLRVSGEDAPAWLQATLSQDLAPLAVGQGARSLLLDPRGAVLADLLVLREVAGFLLIADSDPERPLALELERRIFREAVTLAPLGAASEQLLLAGPEAAGFLRAQLGLAELPAAAQAHQRAAYAGWALTLLASPRLGLPGLELILDAACGPQGPGAPAAGEGAAGALRALFRTLADRGAKRLSPAAAEYLRIAAGRPRRDPDLLRVLPQEAGLVPEAVSVTKGCYPGQEVVMRQYSRGRPRWRPQVMAGAGSVPAAGAALRTAGGESAGWVSSAAADADGGFLAFAYLRAEEAAEGLSLEDGRPLAAREPLPAGNWA